MSLKLPSLELIFDSAEDSLKRFPTVIFSGILAALCGSIALLTNVGFHDLSDPLIKLCIVGFIGIPVFFSFDMVAYSRRFSLAIFRAFGILYLALTFYLLEGKSFEDWDLFRQQLLFIGFHYLVAFAPFTEFSGKDGSFWNFNQKLLLRMSLAVLYSGIIFIGLSIGLLSIDNLFRVNVDEDVYGVLFLCVTGVFNTWFFLSGVPARADLPLEEKDYPKGLRLLTQYTFIPLSLLYLLILYAYTTKIVIEWSLPQGWVSYLVMGFSFLGILAALLVQPLKNNKEFGIIHFFSKIYYPSLIPMAVLMLVAVYRRTSDYGFTERRYLLLVIGFWLLGTALHQLMSKGRSIRSIPISLFVVTILVSYGPWNAGSISYRSQRGQLKELLERNQILVNGVVRRPKERLDFYAEKRISSIVKYLDKTHSLDEVISWFETKPDYKDYHGILIQMGITYQNRWQELDTFGFYLDGGLKQLDVTGYTKMLTLHWYRGENTIPNSSQVIEGQLQMKVVGNELVFGKPGFDSSLSKLRLDFVKARTQYGGNLPIKKPVILLDPEAGLKIVLDRLSGIKSPEGELVLDGFDGYLLIK